MNLLRNVEFWTLRSKPLSRGAPSTTRPPLRAVLLHAEAVENKHFAHRLTELCGARDYTTERERSGISTGLQLKTRKLCSADVLRRRKGMTKTRKMEWVLAAASAILAAVVLVGIFT